MEFPTVVLIYQDLRVMHSINQIENFYLKKDFVYILRRVASMHCFKILLSVSVENVPLKNMYCLKILNILLFVSHA